MQFDGKWAKGLTVLLVGMMFAFGLACGGGSDDDDSGDEAAETTPAPEAETEPEAEAAPTPDPSPDPDPDPDPDPAPDPDPNGEAQAPSITGTWVRDQEYEGDNVWMNLKDDGTYELRFVGSLDVWGIYEVVDSQIKFRDFGGSKGCLMLPEGFFAFSLSTSDLILGATDDVCPSRAGVLSASWSRLILILLPPLNL